MRRKKLLLLPVTIAIILIIISSRQNVSLSSEILQAVKFNSVNNNNCDYRQYILGNGARMDDQCLIDIVRNQFLVPPSSLSYNLKKKTLTVKEQPNKNTAAIHEKFRLIKTYLIYTGITSHGFFIDLGANDGEYLSTTIDLEQIYGWNGLLIEASPKYYKMLQSKNRKAWSINVASCITPYVQKVTLFVNPNHIGMDSMQKSKTGAKLVPLEIQCIPLYTMLAALNITTVDYLSLDVEGVELDILKTIPFDRIHFKFLTIEYKHIPGENPKSQLEKFMQDKGYMFLKMVEDRFTNDMAFIHQSLADLFKSEFQTISN